MSTYDDDNWNLMFAVDGFGDEYKDKLKGKNCKIITNLPFVISGRYFYI